MALTDARGAPSKSMSDIERGEDALSGQGASSMRVSSGGPLAPAGSPAPDATAFRSSAASYPSLRLVTQVLGGLILVGIAFYTFARPSTVGGFFCNDTSISLPYRHETLSFGALLCIAVLGPVIFISLMEALLNAVARGRMRELREGGEAEGIPAKFGAWKARDALVELYKHLGAFLFSVVACWMLTETLKDVVGELRPHFISVCKPDWDRITCKHGESYLYVDDCRCTGDRRSVSQARRSFPSGHSAISFCGMLFTALYLQGRFKWQQSKTAPFRGHASYVQDESAAGGRRRAGWKRAALDGLYWAVEAATPCLQILLLLLAFYVAATRVVDHYHHIRDVVAGAFLGALTALHAAFFIIDLRGSRR
ncbi:hypothetical protein ACSSS7_003820 [Eimeria intestinalis]